MFKNLKEGKEGKHTRLDELIDVLITFLLHSPEDKGDELMYILESIIAAFVTAEEYRKDVNKIPMFDK